MTPTGPFTVHFFGSLTIPIDQYHSRVMRWGDVLEVTVERHLLSLDCAGHSVYDLLDDEPRQVARWGRVMIARGSWPEGMPAYEPGSSEQAEARDAARKAASRIDSEPERNAALRKVRLDFGAPATSSRTFKEVKVDGF
jgi:hypothetical protein